jgi:hypothetical protein
MNRSRGIALAVALAGSLGFSVHSGPPALSCQKCDEDICNDPDELGFYLTSGDVSEVCGSSCCFGPTELGCADLIQCFAGDDDGFAFHTVKDFAGRLAGMRPNELTSLLADHPDHVSYFRPRGAVVLTGCRGALKAVLPVSPEQQAAIEAAL